MESNCSELYDKLLAVALNDVGIYTHVEMHKRGGWTLVEMLLRLALYQAERCAELQAIATRLAECAPMPPIILEKG